MRVLRCIRSKVTQVERRTAFGLGLDAQVYFGFTSTIPSPRTASQQFLLEISLSEVTHTPLG